MDTRIVNALFYPSRLPLLTCHIFIDLLLIDQQPICNYIGLTYKSNVQATLPKSVVINFDSKQVIILSNEINFGTLGIIDWECNGTFMIIHILR